MFKIVQLCCFLLSIVGILIMLSITWADNPADVGQDRMMFGCFLAAVMTIATWELRFRKMRLVQKTKTEI